MTREKAIEIMQINRDGVANMSWSEDRTKTLAAFDMAIKALSQQTEDAISRQAALEKIHWLGLDNDTAIKCDLAIRALSPVNTQEPKTDVLDKIRAEIAEYKDDKVIHDERNEMIDIVLDIIDKYKVESEEQT